MAFSRPSPTAESRRDSPSLSLVRLPLPLLRCTKLQFIAISLAPIRPSLRPPTTVRLPLRLSYPRRGRRDTHQLRHSRVPSVTSPSRSPGVLSRLSSSFLSHPPSHPLAPSPCLSLALTCHAVGRSARRSAATGVANSLLATSAPLGRFRAPAGGIRQYAPRCLAGKLYVVNRFPSPD